MQSDFIHEDNNSPVAKWQNLFCPCNSMKGDMIKCYTIKCAERNTAICFKDNSPDEPQAPIKCKLPQKKNLQS